MPEISSRSSPCSVIFLDDAMVTLSLIQTVTQAITGVSFCIHVDGISEDLQKACFIAGDKSAGSIMPMPHSRGMSTMTRPTT